MKFFSKLNDFLCGLLFFIALITLLFFIAAYEKTFLMFIVCAAICAFCIIYIVVSIKIKDKHMTPEEKEKQRKQQEMIEKAKFYSGNYAYNSWIVKQAEEDLKQRNENINDFIYAKLDEMIEETDDLETKNMILKKKEEFLQEDISNLKKQLRDR